MNNFNNLPLETIAQLSQLYTQPHRHYHNLNHINRCLSVAENLHLEYFNKTQLITAIWFHDAIYNPWSRHNEQFSAELASKYCQQEHTFLSNGLGFGKNLRTVIQAIKATAEHTEDQVFNSDQYNVNVIHYMLDIDLIGLADEYSKYSETGEQIRKEYSHLNKNEFDKGRYTFLIRMLDRKKIFYTDDFYQKYETKARENMHLELNQLYGKLT